MTKKEINLLDINFSHIENVSQSQSRLIRWKRDHFSDFSHIVLTDNQMRRINTAEVAAFKIKIGWLLEPKAIDPKIYKWVRKNYKAFDYILTFDTDLLALDNNIFKAYYYGTTWINETDFNLYQNEKVKNLSMITSSKALTKGHKLRRDLMKEKRIKAKAELFGRTINPIDYKLDALKKYRFSIAVENSIQDIYFTEKIMDCFLTGTVPIYYGTERINDIFDKNGIISFNSKKELCHILAHFDFEEEYHKRAKAIENNFETAKKFHCAEDHLYQIFFSSVLENI